MADGPGSAMAHSTEMPPMQWRHNECDGVVPNHRRLGCLLNRLFRCRSKRTSNVYVNGRCEGNPPLTGGFPSQRASDVENVPIWWRHMYARGILSHKYYLVGHIECKTLSIRLRINIPYARKNSAITTTDISHNVTFCPWRPWYCNLIGGTIGDLNGNKSNLLHLNLNLTTRTVW